MKRSVIWVLIWVFLLVFLLAGFNNGALSGSSTWTETTEMNILPDLDGWTLIQNSGTSTIANGELTISTSSNTYRTYKKLNPVGFSFSTGVTAELRVKAQSLGGQSSGVFELWSGYNYLPLTLYPNNQVGIPGFATSVDDVTKYHTYRITVQGTTSNLYIDNIYKGSGTVSTSTISLSRIQFGDIYTAPAVSTSVTYDYVRYYTGLGLPLSQLGNDLNNNDPSSSMLSQYGMSAFYASTILDDNVGTVAWHTDSSSAGSWIKIDLGNNSRDYVKARIYASTSGYAGNYYIYYSDDHVNWINAATNFIPSAAGWNEKTWNYVGAHRYWVFYLANTPGPGSWLTELELYTPQSATAKAVGNTVKIPQDYWDNNELDDTWVSPVLRDTNYGNAEAMKVGFEKGWINDNYVSGDAISFLKFDLTRIPLGKIIKTATLYAYKKSGSRLGSDLPIQVQSTDSSWSEATVTYNTKPSYGSYKGNANTSPDMNNNWYRWDVKGLVSDWYQGRKANNGLTLVRKPVIVNGNDVYKYDYAVFQAHTTNQWQLTAQIPYLEITYGDDTTPPVTTIITTPSTPNGDNGWYKTAPTISFTTDEVSTTYYAWNSSPAQIYTPGTSFLALNGQNTLYYYSVDTYNNREATKSQVLKVDITAPNSFTLNGSSTSNNLLTFSWNASSDSISGLWKYQLYIDGRLNRDNIPLSTDPSTTPAASLSAGSHTWYIRAYDNAGNTRNTSTWGFTVTSTSTDTTAPTTTLTTSPAVADGNNGWFKSWPKTTLTSNESGTTYYAWNLTPNPGTVYTTPFDVPSSGQNTLYYYSKDLANNNETVKSKLYKVDPYLPTNPTLSVSTPHVVNQYSNDNTIQANFSGAADSTSSVDGFSVLWGQAATTTPDTVKDLEETVTSATSTALANGDWYFHLRTVDNAGNWSSAVHIGLFKIDTTAPSVNSTSPANGATNVGVSSNITATFNEDMNASTITSATFTLKDSASNPVSGSVSYNLATRTATFDPVNNLVYKTTYQATLSGVKDLAGNSLSYSWSFTTEPAPVRYGYWLAGSDGGIFTFGNVEFYGSAAGNVSGRIVDMASTPSGKGYWLVSNNGSIYCFGDAGFYGSVPGLGISVSNIVGMAPTPNGAGYWLVGSDGGIFTFGNAPYHGSVPGLGIGRSDIVGMAVDPNGYGAGWGYLITTTDGAIYTFNADYYGSIPGLGISVRNIKGIAADLDGAGYYLVGSDGGIFNFEAPFYGSAGGLGVSNVVGIAADTDGAGYYLVGSDGGVFTFNAPFYGSAGGLGINNVVGIQ